MVFFYRTKPKLNPSLTSDLPNLIYSKNQEKYRDIIITRKKEQKAPFFPQLSLGELSKLLHARV